MNLPSYSLRYPKVVWFFLVLMLAGGVWAFLKLGKKEDSPFVIKSAVVITRYPGATPEEVEQLITEPIEREIQSMSHIDNVTSDSYFGLSKITVSLDPGLRAERIPQMWDELRRKVLDVQPSLPSGASAVSVSDDFGDVFGIYYGLSADEGFSYDELRTWANHIKRELVTVGGVQKVTLYGERTPVVNVSLSLAALNNLSVKPETIIDILARQNALVSSGEKQAGNMVIRILAEETYRSLSDIENQLIMSANGRQVRLADVASVERGWLEPPQTLMRVNGARAVGIGVSTDSGRDVVKTGAAVERRLAEITALLPAGMEITTLYPENRIAREANNVFILNLLESVAIVVAIIMLAMGFRSGILVGSSLLFSIGGALLVMYFLGEGLNRTSLAGFIIAMGMLVDNAIVVTDGARKLMREGVPVAEALIRGAVSQQWSLLGATVIAVASFLPLYLAKASVAEIVKPLFVVLAASLLLSWVLALSQTPLSGVALLRAGRRDGGDNNGAYRTFDRVLEWLLSHRILTVCVVFLLFAASLWTMGRMPQNFFPSLDKPYFRADCWLPDGYDIRDMERTAIGLEEWLRRQPAVVNVSVTMGGSPPRYYLASSSVSLKPNFANFLVEVTDKDSTAAVEARFDRYVRDNCPDIWVRSSLFKLSPVPESSVEIGFLGESVDTLLGLTYDLMRIMDEDPRAVDVRCSWGNTVPVWQPRYSQVKGQRVGISRADMAREITVATSGYDLGEYREGDTFMPILLREEGAENYNLSNLRNVPIFSRSGRVYPLEQVVSGFDFGYRFGVVRRYDRLRVMKAQCDPVRGGSGSELLADLLRRAGTEIALPEGYRMKVFGEAEDQQKSNAALGANLPTAFILIFIVLLLLFRDYSKPVVILLMIPLIFIGVVAGLLVTGKSFDFFSLLGMLGLVGMNIKNAIVLVSEIEKRSAAVGPGDDRARALIGAVRSRVLPVAMASGTTILGMLPLLFDSMFGGMAATIMGGLFVAALLTIFVLPVTYALFFGIKYGS